MSILKDKRILITGGTGSIGSTLVKEILKNHEPKQIRIFSRDETKQFHLMNELPSNAPVNYLIGDIRDKSRLMRAMEDIDIVFHAAAMKHVTLCERNPFEAYQINVGGTQNVIDCALACGVDRVINISTDKAVNPVNVMGTTKLLAEKLMLASYFYKGNKKTKFCCVRFGNVLWSRGSALPLFVRQIRNGGPLTITNPKMTRFFMSMTQAANLVISASEMTKESEIFVLKMPAVSIGRIVKVLQQLMIEEKIIAKPVPIKIIGSKEGERLHEKLLSEEESKDALETKEHFIIIPNFGVIPKEKIPHIDYPKSRKAKVKEYSTTKGKLLSEKALKKILKEGNFHINGYSY